MSNLLYFGLGDLFGSNNATGFIAMFISFFLTFLLIWYYMEKRKNLMQMEKDIKQISSGKRDNDILKKEIKYITGSLNKIEEQQKFLLKITLNLSKLYYNHSLTELPNNKKLSAGS